jgi:hypothetical protein
LLKHHVSWHRFIALALSLTACQLPAARLEPAIQTEHPVQKSAPAAPVDQREFWFKSAPAGQVRLQDQRLSLSLQLPALPGFRAQRLDLAAAQQIRARVRDFYGHSYLPQGADSNGLIAYPVDGILRLTFNQVVSAPLIFVELDVLENGVPIPQAELSTVFASTTGVPFPGVGLNFETSAVARTIKALHSSQPQRARALDLAALESLMRTMTGVSGTAPTLSYTTHPSLVDSDLLASHLLTRQPAELNPADYRRPGASVNLTVTGLIGTDQLQAQVSDAASNPSGPLGNAASTMLGVTPGGPLKVKGSAVGTPVMSYTYSASPSSFTAIDGQPQAVTLTATPTFTVTSVVPNAARTGATVLLNGSDLTGTTAVRFNGVDAAFTVDSPTRISAVVPATATDGPITVVNRGTWTTPAFDVYRTWYVNNASPGARNGLSWATPYHDLQAALSSSGAYDEIWIATGTYKPAAPSGSINTSFQMKQYVDMYGGFSGSINDTQRSDRDPATRLVTLSGDLNGNDDYTVEPFANLSDNSLRLIRGADNAILDGVTVQGGGQGTLSGAGMYNLNVSPTVNNVVFRNNTGLNGGGLFNGGNTVAGVVVPVTPTLTNLRFIDNRATASGAGLYNDRVANSNPTNLSFSGNRADVAGGGIYNNLVSATTFTNLTFTNNRADTTTAIVSGGGMGSGQSTFTVNGATFSNNQSGNCGGGISISDLSEPTLNDVSFSTNAAARGGGLCVQSNARVHLNRATFSANTASSQGAGMMITGGSTGTLDQVSFTSNSAASQGGGMMITGGSTGTLGQVGFTSNSAVSQGGGLMMTGGSISTLDQVSFTGNSANGPNAPGGGMTVNGSTATLTRTRLIGNTASGTGTHNGLGLQVVNAATVTLSNVLFANHVVTSGASQGGGLHCSNNSTVNLSNATFANNQATTGGGGLHIVTGGVLNMQNTLFWQSSQFGAPVGSQGNFSVVTDPFVSSGTPASDGLRLAPTATSLIDLGISGAGVPPRDILDQARVNAPEPGAYEFIL